MKQLLTVFPLIAAALVGTAADKHQPPAKNAEILSITVDDLSWIGDLATGLELAAKEKKLVFIDFTGETCVNCKINEKNVFPKPEVKDLFKQFVRVQLYADTVPEKFYKQAPDEAKREEHAEVNQKFLKSVFKTEQLPLYVIVKPVDGGFEVVGTYDEGKITKLDAFVEFLKKPLK